MENYFTYIDYFARGVESLGVVIMVSGLLYSLISFIRSIRMKEENSYVTLRQNLGKSILIGLEILIAADIITTVVTEPTINSVTVLGIIVFIRIILSLSLQVEVEGKFPWQNKSKN